MERSTGSIQAHHKARKTTDAMSLITNTADILEAISKYCMTNVTWAYIQWQ